MYKVDLNCDAGESFGNYKIGCDEEIIPLVSSVNIACGFHASDPVVMDKTVRLAKRYNIAIGAHPGLPDLIGFGRRKMNITSSEAKTMVQYQIGALDAFCKAYNIKMNHVKIHGALYNMAGKDLELAFSICEGIKAINPQLILIALSGSRMIEAAKMTGLKYASEVFADRAYNDDGSLVDRKRKGSVITNENEAITRVIRMIKEGKVMSINENDIKIEAQSICIHGDGVKALDFAKKIKQALSKENIDVLSLDKWI